jgi:hypothetical protein
MALHGISTLMPANFSRVPASVRAGGPASVSPLPSSFKKQKTVGTSRENALQKKETKQMHGRRRHGKRWLPNHAGI